MEEPILFLIFNRPDTVEKTFARIKQAKPKRLYVAADGPRLNRPNEKELCEKTRHLIQVDWNCELKTLYRDTNLGCGKAVSQAISWFFENEEEGIIIEDDVLVNQDFFTYCEQLLELYRYDDRIEMISGRNPFTHIPQQQSYFFSAFSAIWGWATWRRVWKDYLFNTNDYSDLNFNQISKYYHFNLFTKIYYYSKYITMKYSPIDTWDYQLLFHQWKHKRLSIIPLTNINENIGFTKEATHTKGHTLIRQFEKKGSKILPLYHPGKIEQDVQLDRIVAADGGLYNILRIVIAIFKIIYYIIFKSHKHVK